eukprot:1145993-Pelagomonas_calceolata.AAC.5
MHRQWGAELIGHRVHRCPISIRAAERRASGAMQHGVRFERRCTVFHMEASPSGLHGYYSSSYGVDVYQEDAPRHCTIGRCILLSNNSAFMVENPANLAGWDLHWLPWLLFQLSCVCEDSFQIG